MKGNLSHAETLIPKAFFEDARAKSAELTWSRALVCGAAHADQSVAEGGKYLLPQKQPYHI